MKLSLPVLIVLASLATACSRADVAPPPRPWEVEVPDGTNTIVHAPVRDEERQLGRVALEVDLVLGNEADEHQRFGRVHDVGVDSEGRIYVADGGSREVRVFDQEGQFVASLGGAGEGPGEFGRPSSITISGDRVFVGDNQQRQLTTFAWPDLEHVDDFTTEIAHSDAIGARPAGGVLATAFTFEMPEPGGDALEPVVRLLVSAVSADAAQVSDLISLDLNNVPLLRQGTSRMFYRTSPHSHPEVVATPGGGLVYSLRSEYQVVALDGAGQALWAMQMLVPPEPVTAAVREDLLAYVRQFTPEAMPSELNAPDHLPAIGRLRIDGLERLHVYHSAPDWNAPDADRPVDIYNLQGELLWSGMAPAADWTASRGEYVYGIGTDPVTEEYRVTRWRLKLNS